MAVSTSSQLERARTRGATTATVVEGVDDRRCAETGAYLLGRSDSKIPVSADMVAQIRNSDRSTAFVLWTVGPSG
jgi:hypothetical protein